MAGASSASASASARRSSTEEQRAKNRLVVKRCYYRKLTTLQDLRAQVTALEDQYARLLATHVRADATPSPPSPPPSTASSPASTASTASTESTASTAVHAAYIRLLQLREALAHENRALQALEAQHAAAERSIAQLQRLQLKAAAAVSEAAEAKRAAPPDLAAFRPLSLATCLAVARAAYREIRSFRENRAQCASTGLSFLGWRDRRLLDQRKQIVQFSLEKVFEDIDADTVADRVWGVLSDPEGVARAYPRSVNARFQVLQHVSDDAVIFYHSLEREDAPDVRIRALILAMRIKVAYLEDVGVVAPVDSDNDDIAMSDKEEGADDDAGPTLILYRGLDPKRFLREGSDSESEVKKERRGRVKLEPQTEDVWMDTFVWGHIDRAGDQGQHCVDDFGGIIHGTALATAGWWMLEILNMALRIEVEAFGPQLRLRT